MKRLLLLLIAACADPGQHEITAPGDLLAPDGTLREPGWAPRQLLRWNPDAVHDPSELRQWDFYTLQSADVAINVTLTDLSFLKVATVGTIDLHTGEAHTALAIANASDTFTLSDDVGGSASATIGGAPVLALTPTTLTIALPASALGEAATGNFTLGPRPAAYLSLATPFDDSPYHFFFEQKLPGIAASGSLTIGGVTYDVPTATATMDWGRGAWPATATWRWAAAAGTIDGQAVAFNLGMGFGDARAGTENIAFVDGAVTKLDTVDWTYTADDPGADWHLEGDGVSLTLHPDAREIGGLDFGNVYSHVRKGYGTFTGTIAGVQVDGLRGFAEREDLSW